MSHSFQSNLYITKRYYSHEYKQITFTRIHFTLIVHLYKGQQSHRRLSYSHTSPDLAPGRAPISDPGASGAIPGSSLRVRGRSVARPCTSGAIRGDPGSTPEVLKCLKHPGRSGEDARPWLIRACPWLVRGSSGMFGARPWLIRGHPWLVRG